MRTASFAFAALILVAGALRGEPTQAASQAVEIPVGSIPMSLVAAAGSIWSANRGDGTISRIDPASNAVIATVRVGGEPWGLAYGAGAIWVGNYSTSEVARIDPATNRVVARVAVARQPIALDFGRGSLWVGTYGTPRLVRIDPARNRIAASFALAGSHLDVLVRGPAVWVVSEEGDVTRVAGGSGRVTARISGGADPTFLTACRGLLWVTNFRGQTLWQVSERPAVVRRRTQVGPGAAGIACAHGDLAIAKYYDNRLLRLDPSGRIAARLTTGSAPTDVVAAAGSVWVASSGDNKVTRFPIE